MLAYFQYKKSIDIIHYKFIVPATCKFSLYNV